MAPPDLYYYEQLEVSHTANDNEIRKSYRKLCLVHHPDKIGPNADHSRFQEIQAAYEILSDPEKRAHYDRFGREKGGGGGFDDDEADPMDFFASMFGGAPHGMGGGHGRGGGSSNGRKMPTRASQVEFAVSLESLFKGEEKSIAVERTRTCTQCKGTGCKAKSKPRACVKCQGQGRVFVLRQMGSFMTRAPMECPECDGSGSKIRAQDACKKCSGTRVTKEKKKINFFVDRGILPGEKIILKGEGDESPESSGPGDLHITLTLIKHATFELSEPSASGRPPNLYTTLSITLSESLLGFDRLILIHLDGRGLRVCQPAPGEIGWRVLKHSDELMIRNEGMWRKGERGDLIVKIEVETPDDAWAKNLKESGNLISLEQILPPKRQDVKNPEETDQIELEIISESARADSNSHSARNVDSSDSEDESAGPQCAHQ